jgi:hypothetical protein
MVIFCIKLYDDDMAERRRLFLDAKSGRKDKIEIIKWAAQNNYDTLVFPLTECFSGLHREYVKLIKRYELTIEAGGRELSTLLPRNLFTFHRDLFRMEQGRRKKKYHFCPTNPKTTALITESAQKLFTRSLQTVTPKRIFHLLPDEGHDNTWCACPACRAFSPAEQNIIAVNSAADVLAKLDPDARISFLDLNNEPEKAGITPRKNMFKLVNVTSKSNLI